MSQNLLAPYHCRIGGFSCCYRRTRPENSRNVISLFPKPFTLQVQAAPRTHFSGRDFLRTRQSYAVRAAGFELEEPGENLPDKGFNFDALLSVLEFLCLAVSAAVPIAVGVRWWVSRQQSWVGFRLLVGQCAVLAGGMLIGAVIRRRQWRRVCKVEVVSRSGKGYQGVNLVERIEKLEEDSRSSKRIVQALSRQLEKLGTRFQIKMRNFKDTIAQTAALAQRNSEATRSLAVEGEILERELLEIQRVLLAMQDQQQKQLELILAIGRTVKLWDNLDSPSQDLCRDDGAPNTTASSAVV